MDANELIERGKQRIAARKAAEKAALEAREREVQAVRDAEIARFVAQAIEPLKALCAQISIGEIGEVAEKREKNIALSVPLCVDIQVEFTRAAYWPEAPQAQREWKFVRFLVPEVREWEVEREEGVRQFEAGPVFWAYGYLQATAVETLDEALALASERFIELMEREQEAKRKNSELVKGRELEIWREALREAEQKRRMFPFKWYKMWYGIVANSDDGEKFVSEECIRVLKDAPDVDGYYTTLNGFKVKPLHMTRIDRMSTDAVESWMPQVETEFGLVRVPPEGAERV
jgi:hypothetical protein